MRRASFTYFVINDFGRAIPSFANVSAAMSIRAATLLVAAAWVAGCAPRFEDIDFDSGVDAGIIDDRGLEEDARVDSGIDAGIDGGSRDALPDAGVFEGRWVELSPSPAPSAREGAAFTYSAYDRAMILAGGCGNNDADCNQTWRFDGFLWSLQTSPEPLLARRELILAESDGGPLLAFGGRDPGTGLALDDSRSWSGSNWRPVFAENKARYAAAAVYDPLHRVIVLFGGYTCPIEQEGCEILDDTCLYEDMTWTCDVRPGPVARGEHAMIFDAARGKVVLFGGRDRGGVRGDTWTFDGTFWEQIDSGPPRARAAMAYDAIRGVTVLFGGETSSTGTSDETWELHGSRWLEIDTASTAPPARHNAALGYDSAGDRLLLFGGNGGGSILGDSWEYHPLR